MADQEGKRTLREGEASSPPSGADPLQQRIDDLFREIEALKRSVERLESDLDQAFGEKTERQGDNKGGAQSS
jgi:hypothetical protein